MKKIDMSYFWYYPAEEKVRKNVSEKILDKCDNNILAEVTIVIDITKYSIQP